MKRCKPYEAQKIHGITNWRYAWLVIPIRGKYTSWRAGQKVRAKKAGRNSWVIERDRWRGSLVPLANALCGVPRICLTFKNPKTK